MKSRPAALATLGLLILAGIYFLSPEQTGGAEESSDAPALPSGSDPSDEVAVPGGDAPGPHTPPSASAKLVTPTHSPVGAGAQVPAPAAAAPAAPVQGSPAQGSPAQAESPRPAEEQAKIPAPASRAAADDLRQKGDPESLFEARRMYSDLLVRGLDGAERAEVLAHLAVCNEVLFFSPTACPGSHFYTVAAGDSLGRIADNEHQSLGVIMASNFLQNPNRIRAGQRLKILDGRIWLKVDKANLRMALKCDDAYIKEYPIGIGSFDRTPKGTFEVDTRLENPDWYTPEGGLIRFGEAGHAIGTRWLGLKPTREYTGYGIHGTDDPSSVPGRVSAGCIRMLNHDVEELYPLIARGTQVVIE